LSIFGTSLNQSKIEVIVRRSWSTTTTTKQTWTAWRRRHAHPTVVVRHIRKWRSKHVRWLDKLKLRKVKLFAYIDGSVVVREEFTVHEMRINVASYLLNCR
jgi:hypothetical protein